MRPGDGGRTRAAAVIIRRMKRLSFAIGLAAVLATMTGVRAQNGRAAAPARTSFTVVETSIADMRTALEQRRVTSRQIVQQYLTRIALYEDRLHAAITVNPNALAVADER